MAANGVQPLNTGSAICSMTGSTDIQDKPIIIVGSEKGTVKMYEMSPGWTRRGLWFPHSISKQTPVEVWCTASSAKNHAFFTGGTDGSAVCFMFQQAQQQQQQQQQQNGGTNAFGGGMGGMSGMGGIGGSPAQQQLGSPQMGGNQAFNMGGGGAVGGGVQMGFNMGGARPAVPVAPVAPQGWGSPNNGGGAVAAGGNMFQNGGGAQMGGGGGGNNMWGTPGGGF